MGVRWQGAGCPRRRWAAGARADVALCPEVVPWGELEGRPDRWSLVTFRKVFPLERASWRLVGRRDLLIREGARVLRMEQGVEGARQSPSHDHRKPSPCAPSHDLTPVLRVLSGVVGSTPKRLRAPLVLICILHFCLHFLVLHVRQKWLNFENKRNGKKKKGKDCGMGA